MNIGQPIPESAEFDDPIWIGRFHDLANAMISLDAKTKIIARYTGLPTKAVLNRYKRLTGRGAPVGRSQTFAPERFVTGSPRNGYDWNIQAAAYVGIYLKIEAALDEKVNRGWLLTVAYQVYERLTEPTRTASPSTQMLSFNRAYDLMNSIGHGIGRNSAALRLSTCTQCQSGFLSANTMEPDSQRCPVCDLEKKYERMSKCAHKMTEVRESKLRSA